MPSPCAPHLGQSPHAAGASLAKAGVDLDVPAVLHVGLDEHRAVPERRERLRLRGGLVERCHLRDPSWFQWPLLEAVIENNIVADFPLCNKSFNCSYSGQDL